MAIGRTFKEALQKGIRSLSECTMARAADTPVSLLREKIATPRPEPHPRLLVALERGISSKEAVELTKIDPWFIAQLQEIIAMNRRLASVTVETALSICCVRESAWAQATEQTRRKCGRTRPRPCGIAGPRATFPGIQARGYLPRRIRILQHHICTRRTKRR